MPDPAWGAQPPTVPHQPSAYPLSGPPSGSGWTGPPLKPRRNTPIIALVVTLGVLICIGLGTTAWLLHQRNARKAQTQLLPSPSTAAATNEGPAPAGSEDARFAKQGDCVVNTGTDDEPRMRITPCASGTYLVLRRVEGRTTGEKDAEAKCGRVTGYTKWYFYDSPLDDLDFVLCLKEHQAF